MLKCAGIGRRFLLLLGIGGCCLWLCVEAAAVAQLAKRPGDAALGKLGVAALYVFNANYNLGVDVGRLHFNQYRNARRCHS